MIHYGLIPRSHRGIFVINELPDLQARIQVALFNILQEGDIQIRGFKLRLPLDVQFVFTANPEDYTNRGSIITPLKDRIDSQILTHYPRSLEISRKITEQEARISEDQKTGINIHELVKNLVELVSFEARSSEYIDQKSGVSARLTISAFENLHSMAERRLLINSEKKTFVRVADIFGVIPSITGKVELVYEGELEGITNVAYFLIGKAIRKEFEKTFPSPEKSKKGKQSNPYQTIVHWFNEGNFADITQSMSQLAYEKTLNSIPGLRDVVKNTLPGLDKDEQLLYMEFVLHGLAEFSQISKNKLDTGIQFKDLMGSMFNMKGSPEEDEDDDQFRFRDN